jgi:tungstate transport system substrate-binding protein
MHAEMREFSKLACFVPLTITRTARSGRPTAQPPAGLTSRRIAQGADMTIRRLLASALLMMGMTAAVAAQTAQPAAPASPPAAQRAITVSSTTSTQDSGLFDHLLPIFRAKTGIEAKVVSQGTGQALDTGRRGDADVVFVHARAQELKFVEDGFGVERKAVMYNDFVLIGPKADPAGVRGGKDIAAALKAVAEKQAVFVSRGDRSGTHAAELNLWKQAEIDIDKAKGPWYREIGQGMGAALNASGAMGAYVLADRATWISFKNRGGLEIVVEGDRRLFNQYGVMLVNPARHAHVRAAEGQAFIDWLVSPDGQKAIADYRIDGQQLFFPNARQPGA